MKESQFIIAPVKTRCMKGEEKMGLSVEKLDLAYSTKIAKRCHERDRESNHSKADELLIDLLKLMGFGRVIQSWRAVGK